LQPEKAAAWQRVWRDSFEAYRAAYPELADQFEREQRGELPAGWDSDIPTFEAGKSLATRASSGTVLNAIAARVPNMVGGSADLTGSNKTDIKSSDFLKKGDFNGRYIYFGVREHGMAGIMNGMVLHGGIRPFGGTFFIFTDYLRPSMRLAAIMGLPVIYVLTHDSIGLGMDGPTHQPIEHLMSLRVMPNMTLFRPADANEVAVGWQVAMTNSMGPTALILSRQGTPTFDRTNLAPASEAAKGAYVLSDSDNPQVILIGTGTEVQLALEAQGVLAEAGIQSRVVSMPSWALFRKQSKEYQASLFPQAISARVAVEAGAVDPWIEFVGPKGKVIGMHRYGASAPGNDLYRKFGITAEAVAEAALSLVRKAE
jgi:transketolase